MSDHLALTPVDREDRPEVVEKEGLLVVKSSGATSDAVDALAADREERDAPLSGRG